MSYLSINQGSQRQVVKEVCEVLPHVGIAVFPQALVIEAVDLCDLSALVVSPQYRDALWESDLRRTSTDGLHPGSLTASMHISIFFFFYTLHEIISQ